MTATLEPPAGSRPRHWQALAAIAALGVLAYANSLDAAFVFDDIRVIRNDPRLRDLLWWLTPEGYHSAPTRVAAYVSFAINHRLGGTAPFGFHAVNLAVHLVSSALVYALGVLAFRTPRLAPSVLAPQARTVALVAAAIFVAHPLQTQAVTYVVQRMTSLAAMFYLLAVVAYLAWRLGGVSGGGRGKGAVAYGAAVLAAFLAVRTKEIAITLPAAILLCEVTLFERPRVLPALPFFAAAALIPLSLVGHAGPSPAALLESASSATRVQTELGRLEYLATQLPVVVTYLFLLLLPIGQNIDHDYPVYRTFLAPEVLSAAVVLGAIAATAAYAYLRTSAGSRRPLDPAARLAGACAAWWFLTLSVESSVIPIVDVINEHRVYLPSVGFAVAASMGIAVAARRIAGVEVATRATALAGLGIALLLAAATVARNRVWASEVTLWADSASKSPDKMRPNLNLGTALVEAGRPRDAEAPLRRAAALDPASALPRVQLAGVLLGQRRTQEAEQELREAIRLAPADPEALFNLGMLLSRTGRAEEARPLLARFVETAPASYAAARRMAAERLARP
ncbi:Tetratricopeptide TPR_4 [Anaeromyxobacter sp. K]|uniref:tetratricopeptide repeat protein n=1 Tax=Anaeromyxobacter sp. (strain K) TaxID=447217 RepID=UPI00015F9EB6|nr:tetratricopeptide repeat protein [Anaeromyxobacter sp. K]ACG71905.1 Tetratricopeptide TPR_4 [Anaeromyxobacter sp. K]